MRGRLADFGAAVIDKITGFLDEAGYAGGIDGIGIGAKGHIDNKTNRYVRGSLFTRPDEYDLCGRLKDRFMVPVFIDNDLNATVLAEARWGAGKNTDCFIYVNIGTGIAVGIIDSGRLIRGKENFSGEVGNSLFMPTEKRPYIHSLESIVSGGGFDHEVRRMAAAYPDSVLAATSRGPEAVLSAELFEAYRQGDALALDLVNDVLRMLAYTLINLEHAFNSKFYVFGGGVVADPWFFTRLRQEVERVAAEAGCPWTASMEISQLGADTAGLLGAASVFLHNRNTV
jgi:predicted NBD/HSP70 family sugar kinase